ncbi:MAG: hypothetical protein E1N59_807 [Puniceicoccaceae bacterium 5H]|nr:MAG: hypothetical protein E1N59_807 [Puniceicoccaceae bacterium 5H]
MIVFFTGMSAARPKDSGKRHLTMEKVCENLLPNCHTALDLVERGCARDLSLKERMALKYHSQLCPFCSCKRYKLETMFEEMREAERRRSRAS